jgi:hypothetical protein
MGIAAAQKGGWKCKGLQKEKILVRIHPCTYLATNAEILST